MMTQITFGGRRRKRSIYDFEFPFRVDVQPDEATIPEEEKIAASIGLVYWYSWLQFQTSKNASQARDILCTRPSNYASSFGHFGQILGSFYQ